MPRSGRARVGRPDMPMSGLRGRRSSTVSVSTVSLKVTPRTIQLLPSSGRDNISA